MAVAINHKTAEVINYYRTLFDLKEQQLNGQKEQRLHLIRRWAMERLEEMGFPKKKDEDYKYTNVSKIVKQHYVEAKGATIDKATLQKACCITQDSYHLIFVNGILNKELSSIDALPDALTICTIKEAYQQEAFKALVEQYLSSDLGLNAFVALNTAFAQNGLFIHLKKNQKINKPIHISNLNIKEGNDAFLTNPQILAIAEASSELELIETHQALDESSYFTNVVTRFAVGKNAHIHHYKLQNESLNAFQINNAIITQERDSTYSSYVLDIGGKTVRNNLSSTLKASGTQTNLYGVYLGKGNQHIDNQTFIDHAFPHCESNELYKGILDDKARGVFNGKVNVRPDAQKTNAFQQNSSLVLSNTAIMDTKPQLEIFADDVRCSHGATIGQLDEDSIYYLRTRGMSLDQAKSMLQFAFVAEVLEHFKLDVVRERALSLLEEKLNTNQKIK